MIELYTGRGVGEGDAAAAITALARYPSFFVDLMMTQELGMVPVSDSRTERREEERGVSDSRGQGVIEVGRSIGA
jgi:hypothetical protein